MNRFFKHEKAVMALFLVCAMIFFIALPVCAETIGDATSSAVTAATEGEGSATPSPDGTPQSLWQDPMFYVFLAMVAGFVALVAAAIYIYLKANHFIKERKYSSYDRTTEIYDDLDEHLWDAPDTVMIDAEPPAATFLDDLVPVEPIRGLNNYTIAETPINPVQAIQMGAEPYRPYQDVTNVVYESVNGVNITAADLDDAKPSPIAPETLEDASERYANFYTPPVYEAPVQSPYVAYEYNVEPTTLSDDMAKSQPAAAPIEPVQTPKTSPITYISTPVLDPQYAAPVIPAAMYEESVAKISLADSAPAPAPHTIPNEATTPASDPKTYVVSDVPITIYTGDGEDAIRFSASVFENTVVASELKDEPKTAPVAPPASPVSDIPASNPIAYTTVAKEPAAMPVIDATIFENNIATTLLENEPVVAEPIAVATPVEDIPASKPLTYATVAKEPEVAPTVDALVVENNVDNTILVDEPTVVEPIAIATPVEDIPASKPLAYAAVAKEEATVPTVDALVIENNVDTTILTDETTVVEPVAVPTPVEDIPVSKPLAYAAVAKEEAAAPAVDALVIENNVDNTILTDEPTVVEPVAVATPVEDIPVSKPLAYAAVAKEEAAVPAVDALVIEN
ncbi:MAG: hypothetical protein J6K85_02945, partial [Clostridia bacterium]|nr:hypothetical protein [Clostridia bacterium]